MVYVKEWLKHLKIKQKELARRLEWQDALVSKRLHGWTAWTVPDIESVAGALGLRPQDLFAPPETVSIDRLISNMPPPAQDAVLQYATFLREKHFSEIDNFVDDPD